MGWVKLVALAGMLSCLPSCAEGGGDGLGDFPRPPDEAREDRIQGDVGLGEPHQPPDFESRAKWVVELFGIGPWVSNSLLKDIASKTGGLYYPIP